MLLVTIMFSFIVGCGGGGGGGDGGPSPIPETPVIQSVERLSCDSLLIIWYPVPNAQGYGVYMSDSENGEYTLVGGSGLTSYQHQDLTPETIYYYKICASNSYGTSAQSIAVSGVTSFESGGTPPEVPTHFHLMGDITDSSLSLGWDWDPESDIKGYKIYRSTAADGEYSLRKTFRGNIFLDTGLYAGTTYYYKVSAFNNYGESDQTSYINGTTSGGETAPSTPTGLSVGSATISSLTISWNTVTGAESYRVYRSSTMGGTYSLVGSPTTNSYTDSGLSESTTYFYYISAVNSYGESAQTFGYGTTSSGGSAPSTPSDLSVGSATTSSLTISWNTVTGAESYRVYRSSTSGGTYTLIGSPTTNSYTDSGLSESMTYYYRISAVNSYGESSLSSYQSGTTTSSGGSAPSVPANLSVGSATTSSLTITWNTVTGAESYKVYRSSTSGGTYTLIGSPTTNSYTNTGLSESSTYFYKVSAVNSYGESSQSSYQSGTTTSSGGTFTPGTGAFSIATGTYTLTSGGNTVSYIFKSGNLLDMSAGGNTVSDMAYSYNTSNGALTFSQIIMEGMSISYTYNNCFTVTASGNTYLIMPGFKKTSGDASSIIGTYEFSMSTNAMGTVTDVVSTITYSSDGTWTVTTTTTGQSPETETGSWDTSANSVAGYSFVTINGSLYMFTSETGYVKQ